MRPLARELVAGLGASVGFVGLLLGAQLGFVPALALSAAVYLGLKLMIPNRAAQEVAEGVTRQRLGEAIAMIRSTAKRFETLSRQIDRPEVAHDVSEIGRLARDTIAHFERDPGNLIRGADFLELHLPKALGIVERYVELGRQPNLDERTHRELAATGETIALIEKAFEAQQARLLERDVEAFSVDRRVYEELLRLDTGGLDARLAEAGYDERELAAYARAADGSPPPPPQHDAERNRS